MSMTPEPHFPTPAHRAAAAAAVEHFASHAAVRAVLLVNSCARGTAVPESDVDLAVLVDGPADGAVRLALERDWAACYAGAAVFRALEAQGPFARVHLDLFDGRWTPERWDDGGGPDGFELEIGNRVAHATALWERDGAVVGLRAAWLPYYGESLRTERLAMVVASCRHNVDRLRFYAARGLYFQAFDRLYHAFQELLQAVFIAHRVYPIAYTKWIREQVVEWLGAPDLYAELPPLLEVARLESAEVVEKGGRVLRLLDVWAPAGARASPRETSTLARRAAAAE